jgi:hypothetical protein
MLSSLAVAYPPTSSFPDALMKICRRNHTLLWRCPITTLCGIGGRGCRGAGSRARGRLLPPLGVLVRERIPRITRPRRLLRRRPFPVKLLLLHRREIPRLVPQVSTSGSFSAARGGTLRHLARLPRLLHRRPTPSRCRWIRRRCLPPML